MKQRTVSTIVFSTFLSSLLVFTGGCAKKMVPPPGPENSQSSMSQGNDINYPESGFAENSIEGSLDDNGASNLSDGSEMSREYKIAHGRSSEGLAPVYFDFDQYLIKPDMTDKMIKNAAFLQTTGASIVIEGNCDDRGTSEYNLALGEKRALSAKDYLVELGVDAAKIRTVSYGEEKPLFIEQDDFAWEQNRRDDFIVIE